MINFLDTLYIVLFKSQNKFQMKIKITKIGHNLFKHRINLKKAELLIAECGEFLSQLLHFGKLNSFSFNGVVQFLLLVEVFLRSLLALLFELLDDGSVGPADGGGQFLEEAVFAVATEPDDTEGGGNASPLALGVGMRGAFENFQTLEGGFAAGGLVGQHTANGTPEEAGRCLEVVGSTTTWVLVVGFVQKLHIIGFAAEERARENELFDADDNDALSAEELFSDVGGESA